MQSQNHISDEFLIKRVASLDEAAFTEIYERYAKRMFAYFFRMLNQDEELARDFVQDLFLKVIEKADSYNALHSFSTWIFTMAANMCKNEYRKRSVRNRFSAQQTNPVFDPQMETRMDQSSFKGELSIALNSLSPEQKTAFVLRYQEGLSLKEISKISQCAEGTVKSRIYYGLKKLAEKLAVFRSQE